MKNLKFYFVACLGFLFSVSKAQNDLTYYHLGSTTPQSHLYNPAFFPDARFYVSLPLMSGVHASVNSGLTWNDIFSKIDGTNDLLVDPKAILGRINDGDRLNVNAFVSVLQLGMRLGDKSRINLFVDERISASMYYPKGLATYLLANANESNLGQVNSDRNVKVEAIYYREYGLGYSQDFLVYDEKKLTVGIKVKFLQGIYNFQMDKDARYSLSTDQDNLQINASLRNMNFNTVGYELKKDSAGYELDIKMKPEYLIRNGNTGIGLDMGFDLKYSEKLTFSMSINDLGRIHWKEHVKNYRVEDVDVEFEGLNLRDLENAKQAMKDTLNALFEHSDDSLSFTSYLNPRVFLSAKYQVLKSGYLSGSIHTRYELGRPTLNYGLGYQHQLGKILTLTSTVSTGTNKRLNWGGGFAARFGPVQLYSTVENTFGKFDIRDTERMAVRFGINLMFGRTERKVKVEKVKTEKIDTQTKPEKVKKTKKTRTRLGPFPPHYELDHLENL